MFPGRIDLGIGRATSGRLIDFALQHTRSAVLQDLLWRGEALGFDIFTLLIRALPVDAVSWAGGRLQAAASSTSKRGGQACVLHAGGAILLLRPPRFRFKLRVSHSM